MLRRICLLIVIGVLLNSGSYLGWLGSPAAASAYEVGGPSGNIQPLDERYETQATRSGRGFSGGASRRVPPTNGSTTGGSGSTVPGANTGTSRTPVQENRGTAPAPAPRSGFGFGSFFGGFALGSLMNSMLFHPFGFGGFGTGGGFSVSGLIFWGLLAFVVYRLFRRLRGAGR